MPWRADIYDEFPFMESVQVPPIAEYNEAFLSYQDGYSVREAAIRHLCSAVIEKITWQHIKLISTIII